MANIAVFVPREYMKEQTLKLLKNEMSEMQEDIQLVKVIETTEAVNEARNVIEQGVHVIVARGLQAQVIKTYTKIPVVEITLTSQDLGLLMAEAKKIAGKEHPVIALIAFENMLSDTTYFNRLFSIDLRIYYPGNTDDIEMCVEKAVTDGADVVIGGDVVNLIMERYNVPALFLASTEDSIRNSLQIAKKMSYTAEVEKYSNAQFETMLDTAFNGIIKINRERKIVVVNRMVEELLGKPAAAVAENLLEEEIKEIAPEYVDSVLEGRRDVYSTSVKINEKPLMIMVAPIQYDKEITGAIVSCHKMESTIKANVKTMQEMYLSGYVAKTDFSRFYSQDEKIKESIDLAKKYSLSKYPVLIYGEEGTEKEQFAQSIHNNSARKNGPFVSINCGSMSDENQKRLLFGNPLSADVSSKRGALRTANYGTLFIGEIEKLDPECQYRLFKTIQYPALIQNDIGQNQNLDVRIIVSAGRDLSLCVKDGSFRKDLYYSVNALTLQIPPLRSRKMDIAHLVEQHLQRFSKNYGRFLRISDSAMEVLKEYSWEGNEIQLENFCERLMITSSRNTIDEAAVRYLLDQLYPRLKEVDGEERLVVYKHPEAEKITALLDQHGGSRNAVAEEMGISTTTLWRKMKKYGIVHKYNI